MTRLEALRELKTKVEAGSLSRRLDCRPMSGEGKIQDRQTVLTWQAYYGSLDAAKALHEAVLPEWCWLLGEGGATVFQAFDEVGNGIDADADTPARAWLLAILSALIAQEEGQ